MTSSSTDIIRAFIAVRPNETAQTELVRVQSKLKQALANSELRIKWTEPSMFHITILFLGNIAVAKTDRIFQTLEKTVPRFPEFGIALKGAGLFKKSGAFWVGVDASPELLQFQKELAEALEFQPGRFHAHFTLGRIKAGRVDQRFFQTLEKIKIEPIPFQVSSVELVKSNLLPDGAVHEVLQSFDFFR